jgi:uncharacterized protein YjeT (DUF2065 family)
MTAMAQTLFLAFALMLVVEGILPFLSPGSWRQTMIRVAQMTDGQLRFLGLSSMLVGLLAITFLS